MQTTNHHAFEYIQCSIPVHYLSAPRTDEEEVDEDAADKPEDKNEAVNQTADAEASTQDAAYERYLCVRVFKPEGMCPLQYYPPM